MDESPLPLLLSVEVLLLAAEEMPQLVTSLEDERAAEGNTEP